MSVGATLRLEDFIQAVQSQLDNAQTAMAIKARNLNLPLTFAIKDINLDLRAHVEFTDSEIRIRPAGPGEGDASMFHLVFTTITRPAIEENAVSMSDEPGDQSLDTLKDLSSDDRRRLEWAGVRTIKQFQQAEQRGSVHTIGRVTNLPIDRLRKALERASAPALDQVVPVGPLPGSGPDAPPLLRVTGRNLVSNGALPLVHIAGRPVSILQSTESELLLAPAHDQWKGDLGISPSPTQATSLAFDLSAFALAAPAQAPAPAPEIAGEPAPAPLAAAGMAIAAVPGLGGAGPGFGGETRQ